MCYLAGTGTSVAEPSGSFDNVIVADGIYDVSLVVTVVLWDCLTVVEEELFGPTVLMILVR